MPNAFIVSERVMDTLVVIEDGRIGKEAKELHGGKDLEDVVVVGAEIKVVEIAGQARVDAISHLVESVDENGET